MLHVLRQVGLILLLIIIGHLYLSGICGVRCGANNGRKKYMCITRDLTGHVFDIC